ncbi:MAG: gamma-glutamylcyclotransferase [Cyanobacteria bacterium P01_E01_bin.6]
MSQNAVKVFVYGTLKPGECNYTRYCEGHVLDSFEAIAYGTLFDLPMGYPAMTDGDSPIKGIVLCLANASHLTVLDELEDYDPRRSPCENEYNRQAIEVFSPSGMSYGQVWTYVMDVEKTRSFRGKILPDGIWTGIHRNAS